MTPYKRPYFEIANPELPMLLQGLPRELSVLDVGCGSGVHGAELKRIYGHRVVGVDLSESSIQKAQGRLAEAYIADITRPERYPFFSSRKFDLVVFSDVLEHLADPLDVLSRHYQLLAPGGMAVISLPNIAIWNVRFELLAGRFEYQDTGTLDRTHLRFFTKKTFQQFTIDAGLDIQARRVTPGILRPFVPLIKKVYGKSSEPDSSSIMDSGPYRFYMKWFYPIERMVCRAWPSFFAFTFMALGKPVRQPAGVPPSVERQEQEQLV